MATWIGVDFDGTLAEHRGWVDGVSLGNPIPAMVERVKAWLANGQEVRIFTARVWPIDAPLSTAQREAIERWCERHLGQRLKVTCEKSPGMRELWDDIAVRVERNTGQIGNHPIVKGLGPFPDRQ